MTRGRPTVLRSATIKVINKRDTWFQSKDINVELAQELEKPINNIAIGQELGAMVIDGYLSRRRMKGVSSRWEYIRGKWRKRDKICLFYPQLKCIMRADPHPKCGDARPCEVCDVTVRYWAQRKNRVF